ncbi:four-helix bundle copper-binding protein [Amycolatopsis sp. NPDC026612]|uniref:four-helix bundle copper-binding protein n=1 Tax=Amycolatopsis sp. NPDC026612 TaxID=3155466 RepID=UPI0033F9C96F
MTLPLLESHPEDLGGIDPTAIANCIDDCLACARACTVCADACLSEPSVADLAACIRTDLDCADLCATTARVLSRRAGATELHRQGKSPNPSHTGKAGKVHVGNNPPATKAGSPVPKGNGSGNQPSEAKGLPKSTGPDPHSVPAGKSTGSGDHGGAGGAGGGTGGSLGAINPHSSTNHLSIKPSDVTAKPFQVDVLKPFSDHALDHLHSPPHNGGEHMTHAGKLLHAHTPHGFDHSAALGHEAAP